MLTLYRACLRLYPGDFRDEYARELMLVLADRLRDERSRDRDRPGVHARAIDPVTFVAAPAVFLLTALASAVVPARRATQIDPLVALRHE